MGTTERRKREKEQRAATIIDAAEKVFFAEGAENATMEDVAREAELSKGTLYLYFKSKEDLYLAINLRGFQLMTTMMRGATGRVTTGVEQVRAIGEAYFEFNRKYPDYVQAMMYYDQLKIDFENISNTEMDCLNAGTETISVLIQAIMAGIDDGSIKKDIDPMKTALLLWASSLGLIHVVNLKGDILANHLQVNTEDLITYYFDFIETSIQNK